MDDWRLDGCLTFFSPLWRFGPGLFSLDPVGAEKMACHLALAAGVGELSGRTTFGPQCSWSETKGSGLRRVEKQVGPKGCRLGH
ncbi:hypothetical protein DPEC_G00227600 [Dallia pectoralis]|uniref:Uncharacterized protein n=1 Tax=Dallia pectoralis TaxID=75939 RepID=A0ACC2G186_DALPE|nr:hypothetical protein DPEC_G00227600 [Dallia pectoralis]